MKDKQSVSFVKHQLKTLGKSLAVGGRQLWWSRNLTIKQKSCAMTSKNGTTLWHFRWSQQFSKQKHNVTSVAKSSPLAMPSAQKWELLCAILSGFNNFQVFFIYLFLNNYKSQTIFLVCNIFKLFRKITARVF